jgi:hypothetical protein
MEDFLLMFLPIKKINSDLCCRVFVKYVGFLADFCIEKNI